MNDIVGGVEFYAPILYFLDFHKVFVLSILIANFYFIRYKPPAGQKPPGGNTDSSGFRWGIETTIIIL